MSLDNITALNEETRVTRDERLSTNSIRLKNSSFENTMAKVAELKAAVKDAFASAEEVAATVTEENENEVRKSVMNYALYVANLEQEINILEGIQGPVELISSRAIRLTNKMITAAKENSKGIYAELANREELIPVSINVEEIAKANEEPIKESIDESIAEKEESLTDGDFNDVFKAALSEINVQDIEDKVNEQMVAYDQKQLEKALEEEKVEIVSDEAQPRERLQNESDEDYINYLSDFYSTPKEEKVTEEPVEEVKEVAPVEEKTYNFPFVNTTIPEIKFEQKEDSNVRDNIVIVPEREEIEEFTTEKVEPKSMVITQEEKSNLHADLASKLIATRKRRSELEKEVSNVDLDIENQKAIKAAATAKEEEARKNLEDSKAEAERAEKEFIERLQKEIALEESKIESSESTIQSKHAELASIKEDTESSRRRTEDINKEAEDKRKAAARTREEIDAIFADAESSYDSVSEFQKVM